MSVIRLGLMDPAPRDSPLAVIALNSPDLSCALFHQLWTTADVRVCADGGANRVFDSLPAEQRDGSADWLPHAVKGDIDSLRSDVRAYLERRGVRVVHDPDQDTHDLEKCLVWLAKRQADGGGGGGGGIGAAGDEDATPHATKFTVAICGAFGGRLDQEMANINMLFRPTVFRQLVLLSLDSAALLMPAGKSVFVHEPAYQTHTCGLIPIGGACEQVSSTGLQWNLSAQRLAFGELVSSSNKIIAPEVEVNTSHGLMWTVQLMDEGAGGAAAGGK